MYIDLLVFVFLTTQNVVLFWIRNNPQASEWINELIYIQRNKCVIDPMLFAAFDEFIRLAAEKEIDSSQS